MANYQIQDARAVRKFVPLTPWGYQVRRGLEPLTATKDMALKQGMRCPDMIRAFYPGVTPTAVTAKFGFLDRDNKEREYTPNADPFTFGRNHNLQTFHQEARRLCKVLTDMWVELGLPLKDDVDKHLPVPDSSVLDTDQEVRAKLKNSDYRSAIMFILANFDIMRKVAVVRGISPGWWCVSYQGKNANDKGAFQASINAHKKAITRLLSSSRGQALLHKLWDTNSDPIDTNPGYPDFLGNLDENGKPVDRIKTVQKFAGIGDLLKQGRPWKDVLTEIDRRVGDHPLAGFPLLVAPLRRLQPGDKWTHQFDVTSSGLVFQYDLRGLNSQRVAHMVPYIYNMLVSPIATMMKAVRMLLPGCYHDGLSKTNRLRRLRNLSKQGKLFLAEADYSNFDRFIPVDIIDEITTHFASLTVNPPLWRDVAMHLHEQASIIWPDYSTLDSGAGWAFKPPRLALMSGVKVTGETGTLVNSIVNGQALLNSYGWTETRLVEYLCQYEDSNKEVGSMQEFYYVQSDDTELIASSLDNLKKHKDAFVELVAAAGLKGSSEFADRFLMRHIDKGRDTPVPARVWQNTLSNETSVRDEFVFLAGLSSRTDGLNGWKSVDPFQTGHHLTVSGAEAIFTREMLNSLILFMDNAYVRSSVAVKFLTNMRDMIPVIKNTAAHIVNQFRADPEIGRHLDSTRDGIIHALAQVQLAKNNNRESFAGWLSSLIRDQASPSSAAILDYLVDKVEHVQGFIRSVQAVDEEFFDWSSQTLKIPSVDSIYRRS